MQEAAPAGTHSRRSLRAGCPQSAPIPASCHCTAHVAILLLPTSVLAGVLQLFRGCAARSILTSCKLQQNDVHIMKAVHYLLGFPQGFNV